MQICTRTLLSVLCMLLVVTLTQGQTIQEFVMPSSGYLWIQYIGGSAAEADTTFGLGTSASDFVPLLTGLESGSTPPPVNAGFFSAGTTIHMGMFTTWGEQSGWAFSDWTDQASLVAFSDIDDSLGLGGSIIQQIGPNNWVLHLDDAVSYLVDDDDNDILLVLRIWSKPWCGTSTFPPCDKRSGSQR